MSDSIVFIDSRVPDYATIANVYDDGTEIIVLDSDRDGLRQISESLTGKSGYGSIQIFSHGSPGTLYLGRSTLNSQTIGTYERELGDIGSALHADGDLLLYGCNVGAGEAGTEFIDMLAEMTGADVAASDDVTGSAENGGDWDLEVVKGEVETALTATETDLQNYEHTLDYQRDYLLAQMSDLAYSDNPEAPDGWEILNGQPEIDGGFAAVAFKRDDQIVIAFRGTDTYPPFGGDWTGANAALGNLLPDWDEQFDQAIDFTYEVIKSNQGAEILVTGHSLGGGLAQVATQMFDLDGATFDPAGARNITYSTVKWTLSTRQNKVEFKVATRRLFMPLPVAAL